MEKKERFKKWETSLMIVAGSLFALSAGIYLTGFPLANYLFGLPEDGPPKKVGVVETKSGGLRRENQNDSEFKEIQNRSDLFDKDTLVTDDSGSTTLGLDGGGKIQLGPNTMVKLSFEDQFSLNGINRIASIQVLSGSVDAQGVQIKDASGAKVAGNTLKVAPKLKPSPRPLPSFTPSPTPSASPSPSPSPQDWTETFEFVNPKENEKLSIAKNSPVDQRRTEFLWSGAEPKQPFTLILGFKGQKKPLITQPVISNDKGSGKVTILLKRPGNYVWQMVAGEDTLELPFTLEPTFEGIKLNDPLVAGQKIESSELTGDRIKDFNIEFSWKPWGAISTYNVDLFTDATQTKPALERVIQGTQYELNKNKVFNGAAFYQIFAQTPNGFTVYSPKSEFKFSYLPPVPVKPESGAQIAQKDLPENKSLLLTWQSTNFTEKYELEISQDESFSSPLITQQVSQNFFVFRAPIPGSYWWRVRSVGGKTTSAPSRVASFTITK